MLPLDKVRCSFYFMSFQNEKSCKLTTEIKIKVAIKASGNAVVRISPRNAILNSCHWKWKHHSTRLSTVRFNQKKKRKRKETRQSYERRGERKMARSTFLYCISLFRCACRSFFILFVRAPHNPCETLYEMTAFSLDFISAIYL